MKKKCEENTNTQLVYDFLIFCLVVFGNKNALIATTVTELLTTVVQKNSQCEMKSNFKALY